MNIFLDAAKILLTPEDCLSDTKRKQENSLVSGPKAKPRYICDALDVIEGGGVYNREYLFAVKDHLHAMLRPHLDVENWLMGMGHLKRPSPLVRPNRLVELANIQAFRLRWLVHMAAQLDRGHIKGLKSGA